MDKLGLYINNLMTTIIDKEEKEIVRKLSFNELQRLNHDIGEFLLKWNNEFTDLPSDVKQNFNQQEIKFGVKNES